MTHKQTHRHIDRHIDRHTHTQTAKHDDLAIMLQCLLAALSCLTGSVTDDGVMWCLSYVI